MCDNLASVMVSVSDSEREELQSDIEKLLTRLNAPQLSNDEWQTLLRNYPQRYLERLLRLVCRIRPECQQSNVAATFILTDNLRVDIDNLMALVGEPPLTDVEWMDNIVSFCNGHWPFVSSLVGEIHGDQHRRAVEAMIERERQRDERFKDYSWEINWDYVKEHCFGRNIVLSDEEVEELFCLIPEQYDAFEIVADAIDSLNDGAGPACGFEACEAA